MSESVDDPGLGRPWRTIGLRVALGLVVVGLGVAAWVWWSGPDLKTNVPIAESVVGQDLKKLTGNKRERVLEALRDLTGKDEYWREYRDGSPHRLYRWPTGPNRWILVVTYEGMNVPDVSWMAIHQFDANWKQTSVSNFPTGYRIALFDVWREQREELSAPAIVVRLGNIGSFGDFTYRQLQYYAFHEGRVALTRIEEEKADVTRGFFNARQPFTGPVPPKRTVDEWIASLGHKDPIVVLDTLTWLGAYHMTSREARSEDSNEESVEDSKLWEDVFNDKRTKAKLKELQGSKNAWIRAAAKLASTRGD